ncbi:monooxygenase family protein, partial [Elioraea sp.]|uniref:monooxygenase family protein n=1 Tax=Elioraea sp. TaxID=2185103 RepID=UPI003F714A09
MAQSFERQEGVPAADAPSRAVIPRRLSAEIDGDFVVFLIGMRINRPWKLHRWLPVFLAMPRMLKELQARPELGLLGVRYLGRLSFVQYWRSFEQLEAYARAP